MRMSNIDLKDMEKAIIPVLTHVKPNQKNEGEDQQSPDIDEYRYNMEEQLMSLVENMKKQDKVGQEDVEERFKEIETFYKEICQKLEIYDPLDRDIFYYDQ